MPIRQPNGIWIPTFSPASRSEVAPSISMVLSEIAKVTVPPSPPLSVRAMANRSMCRVVGQSRGIPHRFDRVEHGGGTARPRRPLRQSGTRSSRLSKSSLPSCLGQLQVQPIAGLADLQFAQFVVEDHASAEGAEWMCTMSGRCPRALSERSIAISGVMPLPALTNRIFGGGGSGSAKSPLGAASRTIVPGVTPLTRCEDREPFGRRLDGDRDALLVPHRHRGQRVRAPVPPAIDAQADPDVLAGPVIGGEAPPRFDRDRRGVLRFPLRTSTTSPRSSRAVHSGLSSLR